MDDKEFDSQYQISLFCNGGCYGRYVLEVDGSDLGQEIFILNKDLCDFLQPSQKNLTPTPCGSALLNL